MALLLLGGLVAAATILGSVYALCLWRFRRSSYSRLSGSVPGSTEKLVTSTEVSIYESREEGGLRDNNKDNEQSRIDAAERKEKAAGKDQLHGPGHVVKDVESESTESSEIGDHESRPLLSGSGPKEAAKYGIASRGREVNHEAQLHTAAPTHVPTKEKSTADRSGLGFDDASVETAGEQTAKSLEISTVADTTTTTTSTAATPLLPATPSETIEQRKPPVTREKDEPADVSSEIAAEKPQELEPLIDLTSDDGDGGAGTLLSPVQTSEVQAVKSGFTDSSSSQIMESEKPVPSVNSGTSALITTEGAASKEPSIADKLNALFQPKQQKETEDLDEHTQTFPPITRSPLPAVVPQVPPKPAPRKSRPTSDLSPRPMSSASPGGAPPPVAAKPTGQARKQVFSSPSAVPVLPMAFGKGGGFVPPALRRKAEVSNGTGEEGQTGVRLPPMGAMFMGGGFGARPRSEGAGVEEPTSFDEVRQFYYQRVDVTGRGRDGERGGTESITSCCSIPH